MRSKLDPTHITQLTFDENAEAVKVKIEATEMNMELNHEDGDSVTAHPHKLSASAIGCDEADDSQVIIPPQDCSSLKEIRLYVEGTGEARIMISPADSGECWIDAGRDGETHQILARRVKVVSTDVRGNVHLVGRS